MPLSLKWKIQLWHALILGCVLAVLATGFYFYERERRINEVDAQLDAMIPPLMGGVLRNVLGGPTGEPRRERNRPDEPRSPETSDPGMAADAAEGWTQERSGYGAAKIQGGRPLENFEENLTQEGYYARILDNRTGEVVFESSNFPEIETPLFNTPGYHFRNRDNQYREIYHKSPLRAALIGVDLQYLHDDLNRLKLQVLAASLVIFALGVTVGHMLVARSLSPLRRIQQTADSIARGNLSERIPITSHGRSRELDHLAADLNNTFQQLEALFSRQTRFTADASHELRTPLTALLSQLEWGLKRVRTPEDYQHALEVSKRSAERIQRITEQLLELSRYDSGHVELEYQELPMDGMLLALIEELQAYVVQRGSELKADLAHGDIHCDPFKIEQVITNLVNNALQHNVRPITILVRGWFDDEQAIIEVTDNGKGIQPENLEKLFDRFFQESASHTSRNRNVGLGLAISKAIVESHGGRLTAESEPEVRTTFRITLPRRPRD